MDIHDRSLTILSIFLHPIQAQLFIFKHMRSVRVFLLACLFVPFGGSSQSVSGYWYGSAFISGEDGDQNSYMVELILTDNGRSVQGVLNYYFLNLYRSIPISATFDRNQQVLTFTDIPFVYYVSTPQKDVDCYMNGRFSLVLARAGTTLSGQWKPNPDYKNICPPIQARLSLDKDQTISDSLAQALRNWRPNEQVWTAPATPPSQLTKKEQIPSNPNTPIKETNVIKESTTQNVYPPAEEKKELVDAVKKDKLAGKIKKLFTSKKTSKREQKSKKVVNTGDQQQTMRGPSSEKESAPAKDKGRNKKDLITRTQEKKNKSRFDPLHRAIEVAEELEVEVDSVRISLYDNGEVDGDSISVFLNETRIVANQLLSARPIQFNIPLDSLIEYIELIMVAENLGAIPPNTALMYVEAGEKTYKILLSSSLEKSASVRIKRKRKGLRIR